MPRQLEQGWSARYATVAARENQALAHAGVLDAPPAHRRLPDDKTMRVDLIDAVAPGCRRRRLRIEKPKACRLITMPTGSANRVSEPAFVNLDGLFALVNENDQHLDQTLGLLRREDRQSALATDAVPA